MKSQFKSKKIRFGSIVLSLVLMLLLISTIFSFAGIEKQDGEGIETVQESDLTEIDSNLIATPSDAAAETADEADYRLATMSNALLSSTSVASQAQLEAAIAGNVSTPVILTVTADFSLSRTVVIPAGADITLVSENGHTISIYEGFTAGYPRPAEPRHFQVFGKLKTDGSLILSGEKVSTFSLLSAVNFSDLATASNAAVNEESESIAEWEDDSADEIEIINDLDVFSSHTVSRENVVRAASWEIKDPSGGVVVESGGLFTMAGDSQIINCKAYRGGGVQVEDGGSFVFAGGKITDCTAIEGGGVYYNVSGDFEMMAGTISGCSAYNGGGIYVNSTHDYVVFQFGSDALIENCHADTAGEASANAVGGGISLEKGTLEVSGGRIVGCDATNFGGGIHASEDSIIEINSSDKKAFLYGCRAVNGHGGGIYSYGKLTLNSGKIEQCEAGRNGGAVYITSKNDEHIEFVMAGGVIDGCKAEHGGGVFVAGNARTFRMQGGTLLNCKAERNGGGLNLVSSNAVIESGTIELCKADGNGGGVYMTLDDENPKPSVFTMDGGKIDGCQAGIDAGGGGGVFVNQSGSTFYMNDGEIVNCTAPNGGGILTFGGNLRIGDGSHSPTIRNCIANGDWWKGGGGIYATGNSNTVINKAFITDCHANGLEERNPSNQTNASGGGIYMDKGSVVDIKEAEIKGCTATNHGGGIFLRDHMDLKTTKLVKFSGNSARFYRLPADSIVNNSSGYSCTAAGSISLGVDELGADRLFPLNNYDISYMSYSVVYNANGGYNRDDKSKTEYELVYEFTPFSTADDISGVYASPAILPDVNDIFTFVRDNCTFAEWSNWSEWSDSYDHPVRPGNYDWYNEYCAYGGGTGKWTGYVGNDTLLLDDEANTLPKLTFNAIWKTKLTITKRVIGSYGDTTKQFPIMVKFLSIWGAETETTHEFTLAHGESMEIETYIDNKVRLYEKPEGAAGYTITYNLGSGSISSVDDNKLIDELFPDGKGTVTIENTRPEIVPTGVDLGGAPGPMLFKSIGAFGSFIALYFLSINRKRKLVKR